MSAMLTERSESEPIQATALPPPDPDPAAWVEAGPFRALVCQLMSDTGQPWPVLALVAGVHPETVHALVTSSLDECPRWLRLVDAQRLYELDQRVVEDLHKAPVSDERLRPALWALGLSGHRPEEIAHYIGTDVLTVRSLMAGHRGWCSRLVFIRAMATCQAWGIDLASLPATSAKAGRHKARRRAA